MGMHLEWKASALRVRRMAIGSALALALMTAPPAPTADAKQVGQTVVACSARGSPARLEVRRPTATVADLLAALQRARDCAASVLRTSRALACQSLSSARPCPKCSTARCRRSTMQFGRTVKGAHP